MKYVAIAAFSDDVELLKINELLLSSCIFERYLNWSK